MIMAIAIVGQLPQKVLQCVGVGRRTSHHVHAQQGTMLALEQVDFSVINGEIIVHDGKLLTIDVPALVKDHNKRSARICSFMS